MGTPWKNVIRASRELFGDLRCPPVANVKPRRHRIRCISGLAALLAVGLSQLVISTPPASASTSTAAFIAKTAAAAQQSQRVTGLPASLTMASAALETGWGRAATNNNYFGIKCSAGDPGPHATGCAWLPTTECNSKGCYRTHAWFRTYATAADSFIDRGDFLKRNPRYRLVFLHANDPEQAARELKKAGYATDPHYDESLISIMRSNKLYRFDLVSQITPQPDSRPASPQTVLEKGSADRPAVRALQQLLQREGYHLPVTGVFADQTAAAVRDFQKRHHLIVDGRVGTQTRVALFPTLGGESIGPAVRTAQVLLTARGTPTPADGRFGPVTKDTVLQWQREHGLVADGIIGPRTWASLLSVSRVIVPSRIVPNAGSASSLLSVARSQVGFVEGLGNANPYGAFFGHDHEAWCDFYVLWVASRSGNAVAVGKSLYGNTGAHAAWFKSRGQWYSTRSMPRPGDIVFFHLGSSDPAQVDHVGIVVGILPNGRVQTIEGNTSDPRGRGRQGVYVKSRPLSVVSGYGRPAYAA